jgi:hypothetical protein
VIHRQSCNHASIPHPLARGGYWTCRTTAASLSVTRKDVRRLKRMSCPATAPFDPRFLVRLERRFLVPA